MKFLISNFKFLISNCHSGSHEMADRICFRDPIGRYAPSRMTMGFTLVELLMVSAVAVLVGIALMVITVNNSGVLYTETAKVNQGLDSNDTLLNVRSNIKLSDSVVASFTSGSTTYISNDSTLVLRLLAVDGSNVPITNTYDHVVYTRNGDKFKYLLFPSALSDRESADTILAENVNLVIFNYYDSTGVEITPAQAIKVKATVRLDQKASFGREEKVATTEASLRNN